MTGGHILLVDDEPGIVAALIVPVTAVAYWVSVRTLPLASRVQVVM